MSSYLRDLLSSPPPDGPGDPSFLHKPTQPAVQEELAPLQSFLLIFRDRQGLAAPELASHRLPIVVSVGVLKVAPCTQQRAVQLQHGYAGPAAHRESRMQKEEDARNLETEVGGFS